MLTSRRRLQSHTDSSSGDYSVYLNIIINLVAIYCVVAEIGLGQCGT